MGDYSVVCAITGIPINYSNKVIGFEIEPYRYNNGRNQFVPKSWVVEGEYDFVGGIEGHDLSPNVALVHKEVWDNAEMYWHYGNRKYGVGFLKMKYILDKAAREFDHNKKLNETYPDSDFDCNWTLNDYVEYSLRNELTNTDEGLVLREMLDAKNNNVTNLDEKYCFIHRSAFGQLLTEKIIAGWTEEDDVILHKLVCLYSGQMITGKFICPSNSPYIEQYPEFKQRIKVMKFALKVTNGFYNIKKKIDKENAIEEAKFQAELKAKKDAKKP